MYFHNLLTINHQSYRIFVCRIGFSFPHRLMFTTKRSTMWQFSYQFHFCGNPKELVENSFFLSAIIDKQSGRGKKSADIIILLAHFRK